VQQNTCFEGRLGSVTIVQGHPIKQISVQNLSDRSKPPPNTLISLQLSSYLIQTRLGLKVSDNQRFRTPTGAKHKNHSKMHKIKHSRKPVPLAIWTNPNTTMPFNHANYRPCPTLSNTSASIDCYVRTQTRSSCGAIEG
jgi:hypothetical protein